MAGSRRGGDYTGFRRNNKQRQKQKPKKKSTPSLTFVDDSNHYTVAPDEPTPVSTKSSGDESPVDPVYADLRHPRDALNILVRLADGDARFPAKQTQYQSPPATVSTQNHSQNADKCVMSNSPTINDGLNNITGSSNNTTDPAFHPTLSDTETLVIGVLGADTAKHLLTR